MSDLTALANVALGVPAETEHGAARGAFLQHLRDQDYVPPLLTTEAIAVVGGLVYGPPPVHLARRATAALAQRIEEFATLYWHLRPDERHAEWDTLVAAADGKPRLLGRLELLRAGLDLIPPTASDPLANVLLTLIRDIYPLPPNQQTERWFRFLNDYPDHKQRRQIITTLRATYPDFVKLLAARLDQPEFSNFTVRPTHDASSSKQRPIYRSPKRQQPRWRLSAYATYGITGVTTTHVVMACIVFFVTMYMISSSKENDATPPMSAATIWPPPGKQRPFGDIAAQREGLLRLAETLQTPESVRQASLLIRDKVTARTALSEFEHAFLVAAEAFGYSNTPELEQRAAEVLAKQDRP